LPEKIIKNIQNGRKKNIKCLEEEKNCALSIESIVKGVPFRICSNKVQPNVLNQRK
jgi:hypothetical protein